MAEIRLSQDTVDKLADMLQAIQAELAVLQLRVELIELRSGWRSLH